MEAQAAAPLRDADEGRHEVGLLGGQAGHLVHHDHEARQAAAGPAEGDDVGGAGVPQQPLPVPQLSLEAAQRPRRQPAVEVGDDGGHVG